MSCAKTAELINLPIGLWTRVGWSKHKFNHIHQVALMCPGNTWRIRLYRPSTEAMRPYVKLLWPLVTINKNVLIIVMLNLNKTLKWHFRKSWWSGMFVSECSSDERMFSVCNRYVDPAEVGLTDDQLREIPYTHVEYVVYWTVDLFMMNILRWRRTFSFTSQFILLILLGFNSNFTTI